MCGTTHQHLSPKSRGGERNPFPWGTQTRVPGPWQRWELQRNLATGLGRQTPPGPEWQGPTCHGTPKVSIPLSQIFGNLMGNPDVKRPFQYWLSSENSPLAKRTRPSHLEALPWGSWPWRGHVEVRAKVRLLGPAGPNAERMKIPRLGPPEGPWCEAGQPRGLGAPQATLSKRVVVLWAVVDEEAHGPLSELPLDSAVISRSPWARSHFCEPQSPPQTGTHCLGWHRSWCQTGTQKEPDERIHRGGKGRRCKEKDPAPRKSPTLEEWGLPGEQASQWGQDKVGMSSLRPAGPPPQSWRETEGLQMKTQERPIYQEQAASWQPEARVSILTCAICKNSL